MEVRGVFLRSLTFRSFAFPAPPARLRKQPPVTGWLAQPEDAATKRSSVAEAIERFVDGPERKRGVELSVVSVEGFATTDEEWEEVRGKKPLG